jgi:hypothetical protein
MAAAVLGIALAGCAQVEPIQLTAARAAAIHDCNVASAKYQFHVWQTEQFAVYGTCMTERGQRWP